MMSFVEIDHIKARGLYIDWTELDQYFPCYGTVMTLVRKFEPKS